jgi:pimeloyl-ACP methyl ester carboxylesterase
MFITRGDAQLFAVAFGPATARPILGLGGWIGNWELWAEPFSILSESWRAIALDHRGSGATIAPPNSITFDCLVDDVFAVLDAFGVERCVLAAESMGAAVALGAALRKPERVSGLVIVDGFYYGAGSQGEDPFIASLRANYAQTLDWFVTACTPEPDVEPIRRWGRQILDRASQEAAITLQQMARTIDLRPDLGRIAQPTLILHGERDVIVPVENARRLASAMPNARLSILSGAGHVPTMTRPREVAGEIMNFFHSETGR